MKLRYYGVLAKIPHFLNLMLSAFKWHPLKRFRPFRRKRPFSALWRGYEEMNASERNFELQNWFIETDRVVPSYLYSITSFFSWTLDCFWYNTLVMEMQTSKKYRFFNDQKEQLSHKRWGSLTDFQAYRIFYCMWYFLFRKRVLWAERKYNVSGCIDWMRDNNDNKTIAHIYTGVFLWRTQSISRTWSFIFPSAARVFLEGCWPIRRP